MAYIGQGAGVGLAADATVTNLTVTGTVDFDATGNIDGPVTGATTPAAGTFTTLEATSLDSTPIGGTTPAAGAFTTLEATSLDSTPIGGTTPAAGSFTDMAFNSGYGSVATVYGCRAWVNFNGTGTVAIRDSGNVSSITDNGTGNYTVNFTNAMPDVNYAAVCAAGGNRFCAAGSQTTSSFSCTAQYGDLLLADALNVHVAIFR